MGYRYYSTQRPLSPGCFPKGNVIEVINFDERRPVEEIGLPAWGYVEYGEPLGDKEMNDYELVPFAKTSLFEMSARALREHFASNHSAAPAPTGRVLARRTWEYGELSPFESLKSCISNNGFPFQYDAVGRLWFCEDGKEWIMPHIAVDEKAGIYSVEVWK
jgi:hypothetical protein